MLNYNQKIISDVMAVMQNHSQGAVISKPVRYGFTTSAILAASALGKSILIVVPTNRIIGETIRGTDGNAIQVYGNGECKKLKAQMKEYPILQNLPVLLPNCSKCLSYDSCKLMDLVKADKPKVICLTYAKLEALLKSEGGIASKMCTKIFELVDVIMFDESHILSQPGLIKIGVDTKVTVPDEYPALKNLTSRWDGLIANSATNIAIIAAKAMEGKDQHLSITMITDPLKGATQPKGTPALDSIITPPSLDIRKVWIELKDMAMSEDSDDITLITLKDMAAILTSDTYSVSYIPEDEGQTDKIYIMAGEKSKEIAISNLMQKVRKDTQVLFVSGSQYEPKPGFFNSISGRELDQVAMEDTRNAGDKMTIIPDSWRLDAFNFNKKLSNIVSRIREISAHHEHEPIYVLTSNKRRFAILRDALKDLPNLEVDYYRSDKSIGVARSERICITVGFAETPGNSCDPLTKTYEESRALRVQGVHATTWQAINRVRDPKGETTSLVYCIGSRVNEIRLMAKWGTNRRVIVENQNSWLSNDGVVHQKLSFAVLTDDQIAPVHIQAERKVNTNHAERLTLDDFIEDIIIKSKKHPNSPIQSNRDNGVENGNYNNHAHKSQDGIGNSEEGRIRRTVKGLTWFIGRADCYGQQYVKGLGNAGYFRVASPLDTTVLTKHAEGDITVGSYQINQEDLVRWAVVDIDNHDGKSASKADENRNKLVDYLDTYGVPYLIELSGSPNSYHIWILLSPTRTYNAFRFIRQVASEAEIDMTICEVFPKQKELAGKSKYGNLVKLPYGKNLKTGKWATFIDPDSGESIPCPAEPPGFVRLLEIPRPADKAGRGRRTTSSVSYAGRSGTCGQALDPCMVSALDDGLDLNGSAGHYLRFAIAVKALDLGWPEDAIVDLFRKQPDFNEDITRGKIKELARYGYHPSSCATLLDKCGTLIAGYCHSCRFNHAAYTAARGDGQKATA
jgi:hypothetical protein